MDFLHILKVLLVFPVAFVVMLLRATIELTKTFFWGWITKGSKFWIVNQRNIAPDCLNDKAYGCHKFAEVNGIKLHYVECGDTSKPLMLFVHGFPESWFSWRYQIKHFSNSYRVVAMDMRGYGNSDKPDGISNYSLDVLCQDVYELITKGLNSKNCILVGHDWGAAISFKVAADHPDIIDKLIIMNGPHLRCMQKLGYYSVTQLWKSWYIFFFGLPWFPEASYYNDDLDVFRRLFSDSENKPFVTAEELEAFKYVFSAKESWTPPINYYRAQTVPSVLFQETKSKKITTPTLIIWGEDDFALEKKLAEMTKEEVENLTIMYIPDANHYVQQHKPTKVNNLMENYLSPSLSEKPFVALSI